FFFSSRRRHTRFSRDWSSDVCSSDLLNSWDVLVQYLNTLAVSDGFFPDEIYEEVKSTFCYQAMTKENWNWILNFIVNGSQSLQRSEERRVGKEGRSRRSTYDEKNVGE